MRTNELMKYLCLTSITVACVLIFILTTHYYADFDYYFSYEPFMKRFSTGFIYIGYFFQLPNLRKYKSNI